MKKCKNCGHSGEPVIRTTIIDHITYQEVLETKYCAQCKEEIKEKSPLKTAQ